MIYHSTLFDDYVWQLIFMENKKKTHLNTKFLPIFQMVGTKILIKKTEAKRSIASFATPHQLALQFSRQKMKRKPISRKYAKKTIKKFHKLVSDTFSDNESQTNP